MLEREYLNICLAEPSSLQANIIVSMLNKLGIDNVQVTESGQATLDLLSSPMPPDVVISALYLPDMTGTDLVYRMREDARMRETPFLLVSSETKRSYLDPIRQAGTLAILPKPFNGEQLSHALNNTVEFLNAHENRMDSSVLDVAELSVLLVDDSLTARNHIRGVLQRIGFERISEAINGQEAVPLLDTTLFDLVVTDYNMPEMDGKQLVEYVRQHSMQPSVPILMVSSEHDEGRLAAIEQAGVSAICDKPFEVELIRKLLRNFFVEPSPC